MTEYDWGKSKEWHDKYYANCSKCHTIENKVYLPQHEGLCGRCTGETSDDPCATCGRSWYD